MFFFITGSSFFPVYIHIYPLSLGSMVSQYLFYQANMLCFQALAPICAMGMSIDKQQQFSQWYVVQFFFFLFFHLSDCVCRHNPVAPATTVSHYGYPGRQKSPSGWEVFTCQFEVSMAENQSKMFKKHHSKFLRHFRRVNFTP